MGYGINYLRVRLPSMMRPDSDFEGQGTPAPIDPPKELVARGLYCFVRNPMYLGGLLSVLGPFRVR